MNERADLLVRNAKLVATCDAAGRELAGGWVAVCWPQTGVAYAGALADPIEAWLRCGPVSARHTVVAGRALVRDGVLTLDGVEEKLRAHAVAAARVQGLA